MANMLNFHTFSICRVYLILSLVLVLDHQVVQVAGDVICCIGVRIPVCVHAIGIGSIGTPLMLTFLPTVMFVVVVGVPPPTCVGGVALLLADLTLYVPRRGTVTAFPIAIITRTAIVASLRWATVTTTVATAVAVATSILLGTAITTVIAMAITAVILTAVGAAIFLLLVVVVVTAITSATCHVGRGIKLLWATS